jgi:30S ribosomal protein S31
MGKGDKRTRKGKIYKGSYGKSRPGRVKKKNKKPGKSG